MFRLAGDGNPNYVLRGMRTAIVMLAIVPLLAALLPFYGLLWGWSLAIRHLVFALLLALVLMDVLFFRFTKIPFACSYGGGRRNPIAVFGAYVSIFFVYAYSMSELETWMLAAPARLVEFALIVSAARALAALHRSRKMGQLVFEERPEPLVRELGLAARE